MGQIGEFLEELRKETKGATMEELEFYAEKVVCNFSNGTQFIMTKGAWTLSYSKMPDEN